MFVKKLINYSLTIHESSPLFKCFILVWQTGRWEVKEVKPLGQFQESNVAPVFCHVVVRVDNHFAYRHFPE